MTLKEIIHSTIKKHLNEDVNSKSKYFSNIGLSSEDVFELIDYHDSYRDLFPNYGEENEYEEEYYFPSEDEAYDDVNETLELFSSLPNPISIYRSIKVYSKEDIDLNDLGESWSYDKESAINFAKYQAGGNYLLSARTKFTNVYWKKTLDLFYKFSRGYDGYDENEINIIDSDEIYDVKIDKI